MKRQAVPYIWGLHACRAALNNPHRTIRKVWVIPALSHELSFAEKPSFNLQTVETQQITKLLPDNAVHQGIALQAEELDVPYPEVYLKELDENAKIVILDHVTDPHNVGAIIRTAAALGAKALIMTDKHSPPLSGALAKAACGGLEVLPIFKVTNLARTLDQLKDYGFWTVGLDEQAPRTIVEENLSGKLALVMGAEGEGLRRLTQEKCDYKVKLPTQEVFSTLNVSVAMALALYELTRGSA